MKNETADTNQSHAVIKAQSPRITIPPSSDQTKIVIVQTTTADIKTEPKPIQGNVQKKLIYLLFVSQINSGALIHLTIWQIII